MFHIVRIAHVYAKYIDYFNILTSGQSYQNREKYEIKIKRVRMEMIKREQFRGINHNQNTMTLISIRLYS